MSVDKIKKSIKVIHILYSGLGGHSAVFFNLVSGKQNSEIEYIPFFCGVEDVTEGNINNCKRFNLKYRYFKKLKGWDFKIMRKIFLALKEENPSAILLHSATFIFPVIFYKFYNSRLKIFVRDTQAPLLKSIIDKIMLQFASLLADRLIFITKASEEKFLKVKIPLIKINTIVIPNGVDTTLYQNQKDLTFNRNIIIGMQSRLQPIKDHTTLIKAFKKLKDKFPEKKFMLRIAGEGATMNEIKTLINLLELNENVEMTGNLSNSALLDFMKSLDIYIHATFGETLSNSILQAMSMALPIIASDVWGVNNLIINNFNGLLYSNKDIDELSTKITYLIEHADKAFELGQNARKLIENIYSQKNMVFQYEKNFLNFVS